MAISIKQLFPFFSPEADPIQDINFRNQAKIIELFRFLTEEHTVLKINLPGTDKNYSSSIMSIDEKNGCFTLDEIFPEDAHTLFSRSGNLIAHAQIRGVSLTFNSSLIQADKSGQFIHYLCGIPDSVSYIQRRTEYRVQIPSTNLIQVIAQHQATQQFLKGNIHDISLNGIGINFNTTHIIKPGDQLNHCKLPISSKETVNFTMNVCHIESKTPTCIMVGGNFKELDSRSSEIIGRFVREMERLAIRR